MFTSLLCGLTAETTSPTLRSPGGTLLSFLSGPDHGEPNSDASFKGLAVGESDELLGDMDPQEMEVKWLHSPLVKIADAIENKTTVYKVPLHSFLAAVSYIGF